MTRAVTREFFLGFVKLHILYHAAQGPVFGLSLIRELARHGYALSPGTLYPTLHALERGGYLSSRQSVVDGKRRRLYRATPAGRRLLAQAARQARQLMDEIEPRRSGVERILVRRSSA